MASALGTADFSTLSNHCYRGMVFSGKSLPGLAWERKGAGGMLFVLRMSVLSGRGKVFLHLGTG